MPAAMLTAGLIMYTSVAVFFTFGLTRYPRMVRGYLIGLAPVAFFEYLILTKCAATHFDWLEPILGSMIIGTLGASGYLYLSRIFELSE